MAEKKDYKVQAKVRDGRGKNDARRARREGMVPITVYGGDAETVAAVAPLRELAAILRSESGRNTIFTVDVEGVGVSEVMTLTGRITNAEGRTDLLIPIYLYVLLAFFVYCYPIARWTRRLEARYAER